MPQLEKREFALSRPCSMQALPRVGEGVHAHRRGRTCSLRLLTEMLISSRNILTDVAQNNVLLATWACLTLMHKICRHSWEPRG